MTRNIQTSQTQPDPNNVRALSINSCLKSAKEPKSFSICSIRPNIGKFPPPGCMDSQKKSWFQTYKIPQKSWFQTFSKTGIELMSCSNLSSNIEFWQWISTVICHSDQFIHCVSIQYIDTCSKFPHNHDGAFRNAPQESSGLYMALEHTVKSRTWNLWVANGKDNREEREKITKRITIL